MANYNNSGAAGSVDTKLKKTIAQAIEDLDDRKLEDGTFLRGIIKSAKCYKVNSISYLKPQVHLDNEQHCSVESRSSGPYYILAIQGCKDGEGSIKKSVSNRNGKNGTQYATVMVHHSFSQGGLPSADVFRACFTSSAARCDEPLDNGKKAFVMTVVVHPNGSWINETTGEVGNVPDGAEPPKTEAQMLKEAEEAKQKESKGKGKGKKKQQPSNKHR